MLWGSLERSQARDSRLDEEGPAIQDTAPGHSQRNSETVGEEHQFAATTSRLRTYLVISGGAIVQVCASSAGRRRRNITLRAAILEGPLDHDDMRGERWERRTCLDESRPI